MSGSRSIASLVLDPLALSACTYSKCFCVEPRPQPQSLSWRFLPCRLPTFAPQRRRDLGCHVWVWVGAAIPVHVIAVAPNCRNEIASGAKRVAGGVAVLMRPSDVGERTPHIARDTSACANEIAERALDRHLESVFRVERSATGDATQSTILGHGKSSVMAILRSRDGGASILEYRETDVVEQYWRAGDFGCERVESRQQRGILLA
jgi:hypothetical protein